MTTLPTSEAPPIAAEPSPLTPTPAVGPKQGTGRVVAIDVARFVALIGMIVAHVSQQYAGDGIGGERNWWFALVDGRASALFALLAGVSLAFMTGGARPAQGRDLRRRQRGLLIRAVLVFVIGLALGWVQTPIAIILCMYAVLFAAAIPLLQLGARALLMIGTGWAVASSILLYALRNSVDWGARTSQLINPTFSTLQEPLELLRTLLFTGPYPALVWFTYVLIGAGIGRLDLRSTRVARWLTGVGAAMTATALTLHHVISPKPMTPEQLMAAADKIGVTDGAAMDETNAKLAELSMRAEGKLSGWDGLFQAFSHSGTLGDLVHTVGSSLLVIGLLLLVVRRGSRVWSILCGAGAMTLTLYSLHVVLTDFRLPFAETLASHPLRWHVAIVVLIGMGFGWARRSGPLEKAVAVISRR